jgi:hypothetical protein
MATGRAQRVESVCDRHRYVDSRRRANRGVFIDLVSDTIATTIKVHDTRRGSDTVWASGTYYG